MALETGQDYYNYYSSMMPWGNQGTGTTNQGTGITQLSTPSMFYPQQQGGGGGFQLPQNYYAAPTYGNIPGVPDQIGISATGLPQTNKAQQFWQGLNFPGKSAVGTAANFLKKGFGTAFTLGASMLPQMSPEAAANQRWAVDDAGFGTGTGRDQFGMLVGESLMDPSRTYQDRLGERKTELEKFFAMGKKNSTFQKQLEHINKVLEIQEQERVADQQRQESLQAQVTAQANREARERVGRGEAKDYGHTQTRSSSGWENDPFKEGGMVRRSRGGILGVF